MSRSFLNALVARDRRDPSSWSWVAGCVVTEHQLRVAVEEYRYLRLRGKTASIARLEVIRGLIGHEGVTPVRSTKARPKL